MCSAKGQIETCEVATSCIRGVDQQKQLQHSQSEISRDSEYDEPQVVRCSSQDRQGHSRDHDEEGCERTYNKT